MKNYEKKQKTALITGASDGIGAAFSKLLIKKGWKVIGISRSSSKLKAISQNLPSNQQSFKYFSCDVQDLKKLKNIAKEVGAPDLLLLNAGIYSPVNASETNLDLYKNTEGFLTEYSKSIPSEDMAEVFSFLMTDKAKVEDKSDNDIILKNKINFIKSSLSKIDSSFKFQ